MIFAKALPVRLILALIVICLVAVTSAVGGYMYRKAGEGTAIVKQLEKDADAVEEIRVKTEIRYIEKEKIKRVIERVVDRSGCLDLPVNEPDIVDGLHSAYAARP